jgi:hypothetical protein
MVIGSPQHVILNLAALRGAFGKLDARLHRPISAFEKYTTVLISHWQRYCRSNESTPEEFD